MANSASLKIDDKEYSLPIMVGSDGEQTLPGDAANDSDGERTLPGNIGELMEIDSDDEL